MNNHNKRILIIGADGLRSDMINPDLMPNWCKLIEKGVLFRNFKTVYPSETRVAMSTLTTGVYPGKHGVIGNTMFLPELGENNWLNTGDHRQIKAYSEPAGKPLLLRPSLGDRLRRQERILGIATSSSPGAALLWNPNQPEQIINTATTYAEATNEVIHRQLGEIGEDEPGTAGKRAEWATRALIDYHLQDSAKPVMILWYSEPDKSLHSFGAGSPQVGKSLRTIDDCLGLILETVENTGLADKLNIILLSDHGHSNIKIAGSLKQHLQKATEELSLRFPLISKGRHIYAARRDEMPIAEARKLLAWFDRQPWCEQIFTSQSNLTALPGVLSLNHLYGPLEHDRAPLFAISPQWSEQPNPFGFQGTTKILADESKNVSGHGTLSPYDMQAFCLGCGPAFLEGAISELPCGLVDIAPTVCHLADINDEEQFDGRILAEGLKYPPPAPPPKVVITVIKPEKTVETQKTSAAVSISYINGKAYLRGAVNNTTALSAGEKEKLSPLQVIAHRGASSYAPENTIAAFDVARAMGVREMELDVHLSRDQKVVVIHDRTVDRTTDGVGKVEDFTFNQLRELDAGGWFSPFFAGGQIPDLRTVLNRYTGEMRFHIELKGYCQGLIELTTAMIRESKLENMVYFTSFNTEALRKAALVAPEIPRGWLIPRGTEIENMPDHITDNIQALGLTQLCPAATEITRQVVSQWHEAGCQVRAYGVKNEELMENALKAGVDGMTINFPDRLIAALPHFGRRPDLV